MACLSGAAAAERSHGENKPDQDPGVRLDQKGGGGSVPLRMTRTATDCLPWEVGDTERKRSLVTGVLRLVNKEMI